MYRQLGKYTAVSTSGNLILMFQGVLTKGTIVEVNVSELGLVTAGGKLVWGRWAQITVNDGCVNA
jgi:ribosomal protein S8E